MARRTILCLLVITFLISCKPNNSQNEKQVNSASGSISVVNDPKSYLNVQTESFVEIDSSGVLMFPLSIGETEREDSKLSYRTTSPDQLWNVIFYNSKTNTYHLLSDRKLLIVNYDYDRGGNLSDESFMRDSKYIFYVVRIDDVNKDQKFTSEDPEYLFISDKSGNNFRQISPKGYHLTNWKYINGSHKVVMTAIRDSNKDNKIDRKDETTVFEIDPNIEKEPKEVFSSDFKSQLKILFNRDWKHIE